MTESSQDSGRWQLTESSSADSEAIRALFHEVFGHEMTSPMWQWKYGEGRGHACLVWRDDQLVAHYGGLNRKIMLFGQPDEAVQIGDVMVKALERGTLSRKGPFMIAASGFIERYIGDGCRYALGYGFPTRRAMQAAVRQKLYAQVDSIVEHRWALQQSRPAIFSSATQLSINASAGTVKKIEATWQAMRGCFKHSVLGVRDWDYLVQRYLKHPLRQYQLFLICKRFTGKPLGVVVLQPEGRRSRLMDIVGDSADFPRLLGHAQKIACSAGAEELYGWITRSHAHLWNGTEEEQDVCVPSSVWQPGLSPEQVSNRWWLTFGDADFC